MALAQSARIAGGAAEPDPFVAARRHSALVRFLRWAIPLGTLAGGVFLFAKALLPSMLPAVPGITLGRLSLQGSRITMEAPKLTGARRDGRLYAVSAEAAHQDLKVPHLVELDRVHGTIGTTLGATVLAARRGRYDNRSEMLELLEGIEVTTAQGHRAVLVSATVDLKRGHIQSSEAVELTSPDADITADALEVRDGGAVIVLTGRVRSLIRRTDAIDAAATPQPPAADLRGELRP